MRCYFFVSETFVASIVANSENRAREVLVQTYRENVFSILDGEVEEEDDDTINKMFDLVDSVKTSESAGLRKFTDEINYA